MAENGGNLQICLINARPEVGTVLRRACRDASEFTGFAFSPDGPRLHAR